MKDFRTENTVSTLMRLLQADGARGIAYELMGAALSSFYPVLQMHNSPALYGGPRIAEKIKRQKGIFLKKSDALLYYTEGPDSLYSHGHKEAVFAYKTFRDYAATADWDNPEAFFELAQDYAKVQRLMLKLIHSSEIMPAEP